MASDEIATRLSAVRALAEAGGAGGDLSDGLLRLPPCAEADQRGLQADETFRDRANRYLELPRPYEGQTKVVHFLELLRDTVGFDHLKEAVKRPLTGRKIGAYYGCLLLRPGKDMAMDDPKTLGF